MSEVLARINKAELMLEQAEDAFEVMDLEALGKAAQVYAIEKGADDLAVRASIFVLKARRKATGLAKDDIVWGDHGLQDRGDRDDTSVTLADFGWTKKDYQRRKEELSVPEEKFKTFCDERIEMTVLATPTDLRRLAEIERYAKKPLRPNDEIRFGYWALPRPLTKTWGSGQVFKRICENEGAPDVAFGVTDGIPSDILGIDRKNGYEWAALPFKNNQFKFGYWDPPYDTMYKKEGVEIWRTCQQLAILHILIYPRSWFDDAIRIGMYAVTMGPMKKIRCLQVFRKADATQNN